MFLECHPSFGFCGESRVWVSGDSLPRDLLQNRVLSVVNSALAEPQADGTDAIDRGEVAVRRQGHHLSLSMTDFVAEQFRLSGDTGKLAVHDHGSQFHDRISGRDDKDG